MQTRMPRGGFHDRPLLLGGAWGSCRASRVRDVACRNRVENGTAALCMPEPQTLPVQRTDRLHITLLLTTFPSFSNSKRTHASPCTAVDLPRLMIPVLSSATSSLRSMISGFPWICRYVPFRL